MPRALAFFLAAATLVGCAGAAEQPIIQQFFTASRLRDHTMLATVAATSFEPATDGIVTTFTITNVAPEQRAPLTLESLAKAHAAERIVADLSINGGPNHVDVGKYDGEMGTKQVAIAAPVRLPNGQTAEKHYVVTMQRAVLKGDTEMTGRWIITSVTEGSGSPSPPRS